MWHDAVYRLLDVTSAIDAEAGQEVQALEWRWRVSVPAAVREWVVGDWRYWKAGKHIDYAPNTATLRQLAPTGREARFLVIDEDGQGCCAFVVAVDEGDDPPVYLIGPDDTAAESRSLHARSFTEYALATVWDSKQHEDGGGRWAFSRALPPGALPWLGERLQRLPRTFGWAGNRPCEVVHRFTGRADVLLAVSGDEIHHSHVNGADRAFVEQIADLSR
ncbi:hypothetical protein ACTI_73450 [Actinoplanes sp. OR16]|uniref:hypothetical protein n=1 Tax=Actinoplanes sp. OR16 TaxID=946334 RepID=UPI000F6C5F42|nr:hypothetical protein [Actinoplanes sp. OR16]BBH70660.1 hypothetical protein ACTI_73450 [Actinoplanes sp. OR16]